MASKRSIFSVTTPLGHRVTVSRDRWRLIVRLKHPAMAGQEKNVRACLQNPTVIRASAKSPDVHLYYRKQGRFYLCVVVAPGDPDRFVVTAYWTRNIKEGTVLWKK